ncbi:MAG: HU family DNA-binding protein [Prevotella sp.]|nr:HU family DNA-binding protein [Prevotella sp.]
MNNKEFISRMAEKTKMTQKAVTLLVDDVVEAMAEHFAQGDSAMITHLGLFEVREKKARVIVNPESKLKMHVPAKTKLVFKPILAVKENVNK